MNKKLDDALCKDFPKIFTDRHEDMLKTAMCWGFECDDGWEWLIRELCEKLQYLSDLEGHQAVASQVKEKYGFLDFYLKSGTDLQYDIIDLYCSMSSSICEICGDFGAQTRELESGHWVKTLCTKHAIELNYKLDEHGK